jgi:hypothetical protein
LLSRIIFLTRAEFGPGADRQRLARSPSVVILSCWSGCLDRRSGLRRAIVVPQQTSQAFAALHCTSLPTDFRPRLDQPVVQSPIVAHTVVMIEER